MNTRLSWIFQLLLIFQFSGIRFFKVAALFRAKPFFLLSHKKTPHQAGFFVSAKLQKP